MALWCFSWWITHNFVQSLILSRYVPQHQSWRQYLPWKNSVHSSVTKRFRYSHLTLLASLFLLCFQDIWPRISLSCTSLRIVRGDTPILEAVSSVKEFGTFSRDDTMSLRYCFSSFNLFISALLSGYLASYISFLHISSDSARRYTNLGGSIFCERIRCILQCGHDVRNIVPSVNVDDTMSLTLCLLWTLRKRFPQRYNQVLCAFQWLFYSCFAFRIFGLVYLFPAL